MVTSTHFQIQSFHQQQLQQEPWVNWMSIGDQSMRIERSVGLKMLQKKQLNSIQQLTHRLVGKRPASKGPLHKQLQQTQSSSKPKEGRSQPRSSAKKRHHAVTLVYGAEKEIQGANINTNASSNSFAVCAGCCCCPSCPSCRPCRRPSSASWRGARPTSPRPLAQCRRRS